MRALLDGVEIFDLALWLSGLLFVLVLIGVRVAFAAAFIGILGLCAFFMARQGFDRGLVTALQTAGQIPHAKSSGYALSLIPTFILIGYLAYYAGLTKTLFEAAKRWVGWLPGGLGVATVFATAGFAAVSGASVATSAVFARIAIPEMLKLNYDKAFSAGVVAAGGTLASLIPPSAILVIYAIIVEESVGLLLLAGFVPGAVSALIYGGLVVGLARLRNDLGPPVRGYSFGDRLAALPGTFPIVFVIFIIIFSIYYRGDGGAWATPTEAGALGAFAVMAIAVIRGMKWAQLKSALIEAAKLTAMIFAMIWGVLIYVRFLGFANLPSEVSAYIAGLDASPYLILLAILAVYVILGMFMDAIGMLILTLPVTFPVIIALNGGPDVTREAAAFGMTAQECAIWFGIIVV
ncbi:MAG: TRAP transporter large permease subunit, partial [Pseudomonadota bacterium]